MSFDLVGNYQDASDIAQDAFIRAYDKMHQFNAAAKFSTWLFRITVNIAMDFHRHRRPNAMSLSQEDENDLSSYAAGPVEEIEKQETATEFKKNLDKLSPQQRTVVILKFYHDKSYREIADIMACTESTIRNHNARAMAKLREYCRHLIAGK